MKDDAMYERLRDQGNSKAKSARIANQAAASSRSNVAHKGGRSGSYDDWSKSELYKRAQEIGIDGRSSMSKSELISALRNS
ncbi:MAG TPA: Rho termination factor N-terminal domain-containing protein [Microlunatus sp.]